MFEEKGEAIIHIYIKIFNYFANYWDGGGVDF